MSGLFGQLLSNPVFMGIIGGIFALVLFLLTQFGLLGPQEQIYRLGGQ